MGGAVSMANGDDFASGALSGGFGAAVSPATFLLNQQMPYSGLATTVAVGGTTSALAGGDAGQGAWTAGMGYIFNASLHMVLNGQSTTQLVCDDCGPNGTQTSYSVFSGNGDGVNDPAYANSVGIGPIPPPPQGPTTFSTGHLAAFSDLSLIAWEVRTIGLPYILPLRVMTK